MRAAIKGGPALTLQHFVLQSSILHAYRAAVRATRPLPDVKTRRETLDWLRSDLERLRLVNDLEVLRTGLSNFQRTIKTTMGPSLGLTGPSPEFAAKLVGRGGHRT
ncbi:hypothetical protein EHS25_009071 [Saitozyma podzolica]|uniref:Mitochondrial zinc maintenance protein 1, mitochondrial n=1 Tax=Saitozyma podzolica TaxID=1890683 RepID=A0A427YKR9_9TREE|nr:hypothetical protein EHS25_009071 [Saitozyma podzolica]